LNKKKQKKEDASSKHPLFYIFFIRYQRNGFKVPAEHHCFDLSPTMSVVS